MFFDRERLFFISCSASQIIFRDRGRAQLRQSWPAASCRSAGHLLPNCWEQQALSATEGAALNSLRDLLVCSGRG